MEKILAKYPRFTCVWHFTDCANLASIRKHGGLLSLAELTRRGIAVAAPGGNEWSHDADRRAGLDEYVHLSFIRQHPMLYAAQNSNGRIANPVWLRIKAAVILDENVRFAADIANKKGVELLDAGQAAAAIDFELLFGYANWKDPKINKRLQQAKKAEILVPNFVPIEQIINLSN